MAERSSNPAAVPAAVPPAPAASVRSPGAPATAAPPAVPPELDVLLNPRRTFTAWWGVGSICAGALAFAFLPAALLGGGSDWAVQIDTAAPIWAALCVGGVFCGIRGM